MVFKFLLLSLYAVVFFTSILQPFYLFHKKFLLCRPVKSTGAAKSLLVLIDFKSFDRSRSASLSGYSPGTDCHLSWNYLWFGKYSIRFANLFYFDVLNHLHYRKCLKDIAESENIELNITVSDSGIIFILYSLQLIQKA